MQQVNLGLVGGGTVGGGVFQALQRNGALMALRLGIQLNVMKVAVRDPRKNRAVKFPASVLTADWQHVVNDPAVNVVVDRRRTVSGPAGASDTVANVGRNTVTATEVAELAFPALSRATAQIVWAPVAAVSEFHETENGATVALPSEVPFGASRKYSTSLRPDPPASDAEACTDTAPVTVAPAVGAVMATVGGVVSGVTAPDGVTTTYFDTRPMSPLESWTCKIGRAHV